METFFLLFSRFDYKLYPHTGSTANVGKSNDQQSGFVIVYLTNGVDEKNVLVGKSTAGT